MTEHSTVRKAIKALLILSVCLLAAAFALAAAVRWAGDQLLGKTQDLDEHIPKIVSRSGRPDIERYVAELAPIQSSSGGQTPDRVSRLDSSRLKGQVASGDLLASTRIILTHEGKYWSDDQHLYVFSEATGDLDEIGPFIEDSIIEIAYVCWSKAPNETCVIAALSPRVEVDPERDEIWSYSPATRAARRISNGARLAPSPDRTRIAFLRSDGRGFHRYEWCELSSGRVQSAISLWEVDPGSGTSFDGIWSSDSKALRILGEGLGFREFSRDYTEYDLFVLLDEDVMVSLK